MTQFKETVAFEDLQRIIGNEIAGAFLARLKEFNVPDDRLRQVSEDICYDIASAINAVGDIEIPDADQPGDIQEEITQPRDIQEEITDRVDQPESDIHDMPFMEEETDEFEIPDLIMDRVDQPEPGTDDLSFMEEATDEFELPESSTDDMASLEEKTDEVEWIELRAEGQSFLEENTDEIDQINVDSDDQRPRPVAGVLSQNEILKILDTAKAAST